jgi:glyoxylase-like metal-dependent hydrolase (beta-lactamase superfamily II)
VSTPGAIPFVRDLTIDYGRCDQVSPLIRRVVARNPSKFTYLGTGTYLVGRGEVAVIDPGPALDAHVAAIVAALEPTERITHVVITHTHSDHSPGAALLRSLGIDAPTYGFGPHGLVAPDDADDVVVFGDPEADGSERSDKPVDELREGADTDFVPAVRLGQGDVLHGDGWHLQAVHTPGHTSNHVCFALPEERALFTGDHVMGWSTTVIGPPDGSLRQYLASLDALTHRDDRVYWPTHGPCITDPKPFVRALIDHRRARSEQIMAELGRGPATIAELVPRIYAAIDKKLWRPAAASTFAHLLALIEDERVRCDGEVRRTAQFRVV